VPSGDEPGPRWSQPVVFTGTAHGIASVERQSALVLVTEPDGLVVHRGLDAGSSWAEPVWIDASAGAGAIAAWGADVDVVWFQRGDLCYANSADGGATFGPAMPLSDDPMSSAAQPRVARGSDGSVAVLWEDDAVQVRVSTDGGSTFGPASQVVEGTDRHASLAVGEDVVYVAYYDADNLLVRRSLDAGASWDEAQRLDSVVYALVYGEEASIAADGSDAYVAYAVNDDDNSYIRLRQTSDKGGSWAPFVALSPRDDLRLYSHNPVITLRGGTIHVAYGRCNYWFEGSCDLGSNWASDVVYRRSSNGRSWSPAEIAVVGTEGMEAHPIGLSVADQRVVGLYSWTFGSENGHLTTRTP
jgi:hypothetical protein